MPNEHIAECEVTVNRKDITEAIQAACRADKRTRDTLPADGSEKSMAVWFSILHGIVNEYLDDGDQEKEVCTCTDPHS